MNFLTLSDDILDLFSDPLVFLDKGSSVVFFNQSYRDFFSPEQQANIFSYLHDIDMRFRQSGKAFALNIPFSNANTSGHEFSVCIFSLDNAGNKQGINLALFKPRDNEGDSKRLNFEAYLRGTLGEQEISSKRLNPEFDDFLGENPKFKKTLFKAQKAAGTDLPVIIIGESGTGKEKLARIIHKVSLRRELPFVDVNCAAIPDSLIESELFGYEGGAFTGARQKGKRGLLEEAHKGSIFLDEIGDTAPSVQSRLLRVLQEGQFKKVGGTINVSVDLRVISATNKDLEVLIREKRFRNDLYYRLNTISLMLPPLRNRGNDIRLLANYFLREHSLRREEPLFFSEEALDLMDSYKWPGNIRELRSVVDYAATMSETHEIGLENLPKSLFLERCLSKNAERPLDPLLNTDTQERLLPTIIHKVEKEVIEKVLKQSNTKTEALNRLGISRRTFYKKLRQHDLLIKFSDVQNE